MARKEVKSTALHTFLWFGRDRKGNIIKGESRAPDEKQLKTQLRRQGIIVKGIKKRRLGSGKAIKPKDIAIFTRQLATMMKSGVPLLQTFEIVARGNANPRVSALIDNIRASIETGSPLNVAFRKYPQHFNELYCNLVEAGESAGILEGILDRLAMYLEKTEGIKSKIKSALMYPISVMLVAIGVVTVIMLFVIPSFKKVFSSFGAELPAPTLLVIAMSDFFTQYWWLVFGSMFGGIYLFMRSYRSSRAVRAAVDRLILRIPVFGSLVEKSIIARWTRTLSTMFAAGVPLVESLSSVGGAAGNVVFSDATEKIRTSVATGSGLTMSMSTTGVFPQMVLQMSAIGEESGTLDQMLSRAADFYEAEVDEMVAGLSSLLEPIIIVFLGTLIGGIVVAMYLPIFKLGDVV
jgi:type IV pilus assembly protein PilC